MAAALVLVTGAAGCQPPLPALVQSQPPTLPHVVVVVLGSLSPLPPEKLTLLTISADAAANIVLEHEQETGWPDPAIAWKHGGCVLTAWYERHPMSRMPVPPDPSAVYIVRLHDRDDAARVTWVMVEAATGEIGAAFGGPAGDVCVPDHVDEGRLGATAARSRSGVTLRTR